MRRRGRAINWYRVYLASNPADAVEVQRVIESIERRIERIRERRFSLLGR